jgi:predicted N-acyltransferase
MKLSLRIHQSIRAIPREEWDRLAGEPEIVPFLEWDWLAALEESGSVSPETGWQPLHLCLWEGKRLAAAAPLYLKAHSEGEFVWDYFWAEAAGELGRPWFPKLVGTLPATPAEGYRFLCSKDHDPGELTGLLLDAAEGLCRESGVPGLHFLFADPAWGARLPPRGYSPWEHSHFIWENRGCGDFEDYLSGFTKNQRKNIRREYRRAGEQGIRLRVVPGEEAGDELFERIFELYNITNDKFAPWDARYVNGDFFRRLGGSFRRRIAFSEARGSGGEREALAFMVRKGGRLWGRYWGAYREIRDLHFGVCYYAPIDWAIREGIRSFDPGAGSPHKVRRAFRAAENRSYHKLFDPLLERLFRANIGAVNREERERRLALNEGLPLKEGPLGEGPRARDGSGKPGGPAEWGRGLGAESPVFSGPPEKMRPNS